jgi:hypothetical protein
MSKRILKGRIERKDISKNEVAQITKRYLSPCWCGRTTFRLSANEPENCYGCNNPVGLCQCKPIEKKVPMLVS